MKGLQGLYQKLCAVEEVAAQACLIISAVIVTWGAVFRSIGHPASWSMELAGFFFGWAVFLSADAAMRHDRHVAVELFVQRLPVRVQYCLKLLNYALILAFLGALVWYGASITWISRFRAFQGIPGFSYSWVTLSVPVGSLLLAITTVDKMVATVRAWREGTGPRVTASEADTGPGHGAGGAGERA